MVNTTLQDAALFANPKHVVGNNSAGPVQTSIFPNYGAVPNRFGNNKVFLTDNMYDGTTSNIKAAQGKYSGNGSPLAGGRRRKRRQTKGKRSNAGMQKTAKKSSPKKRSSPKKHSTPHAKSGECRYCDYGDEGEHKQSPSNLCRECQDYARRRGLLYEGGVGKRLQTMGPAHQSHDAITANGGRVPAGHPQVATYHHSGSAGGSYKKRRLSKGRKSKKVRRSHKGGAGDLPALGSVVAGKPSHPGPFAKVPMTTYVEQLPNARPVDDDGDDPMPDVDDDVVMKDAETGSLMGPTVHPSVAERAFKRPRQGGSYKKRKAKRGRKTKRKAKGKKHRRSRKGGMGCKGDGPHKHKKKGGMGCKGDGSHKHKKKGGMGCKGNGSHKKKGKKSKRSSRKGGCKHLLNHLKSGGSGKQLEFAQGFGLDGKNDTNFGALSSPIPIKAYNSCGVVSPRN